MKAYIVKVCTPNEGEEFFHCMADDREHAVEQALDGLPGGKVAMVYEQCDTVPKCDCGGEYEFMQGCGAWVCEDCGRHHNLARCYCGWSESGGDGYRELEELGEQIEEE